MSVVLAAMMPENRLVMQVCMATALRVSDVLALPAAKLAQRMTIRELKTGKNRRVRFPDDLYRRMVAGSGKYWVFPGRVDPAKHRTRQAVWRDVQRVVAVFRASGFVPQKAVIGTHTARKMAAVDMMQRTGDMQSVARLLNHSGRDESVTSLYALADAMTAKKLAAGGARHGKA